MKIEFLGSRGSYSFIAACKHFPKARNLLGKSSFAEIFHAVEQGECDCGIVPIENSLTGSLYNNYDLLLQSILWIEAEIILKINHVLLVSAKKAKIDIKNYTQCFAHPEAAKQCAKFLSAHKNLQLVLCRDTASAARKLLKIPKGDFCAIANRTCAKLYNLSIVKENIADNPNNYTRFFVLSKKPPSQGEKMTIMFSVVHEPGSLLRAIEPYAQYGMNLTKIESRPVFGKPWEYIFIVDFEKGSASEAMIKEVFSHIKEHVNFIKVLGTYQKGKIYES